MVSSVAVAGRFPLGLEGAACGLMAVSIWAGWSVMTRLAVTTGLDAWDIPALCFGVAGLLMLPVVIQRGLVSGGSDCQPRAP